MNQGSPNGVCAALLLRCGFSIGSQHVVPLGASLRISCPHTLTLIR